MHPKSPGTKFKVESSKYAYGKEKRKIECNEKPDYVMKHGLSTL